MDGKLVVSKKTRRERALHGVTRKIGFYQRRQVKKGVNYSREIAVLSRQAEIINLKLKQG